MKILTTLSLALLFCVAQSQVVIKTKQFNTENGLPQNSANQIHQDQDGYIWIGTQDGLARFNGYEFVTYRPDAEDSFSISDNFIIEFVEDRFGRFWISTRDGLNLFDPKQGKFYKINNANDQRNQPGFVTYYRNELLISFNQIEPGHIYALPDSLMLTRANNRISELATVKKWPYGPVRKCYSMNEALIVFDTSSVWLVSQDTSSIGLGHYNSANQTLEDFCRDSSRLLVATNDGILKIDLHEKTLGFSPFRHRGLTIASNERGYLYGTVAGMFQLDDELNLVKRVDSWRQSFENVIIHDLYVDDQKRMWIGTANLGLFLHTPSHEQFSYLDPNRANAAFQSHVWDSYYRDGKLLIGTNLGVLDWNLSDPKASKLDLSEHLVKGVLIDGFGNYIVGTSGNGLYIKKPGKDYEHYQIDEGRIGISEIIESSDGSIWVATLNKGVWKGEFENGTYTFRQVPTPSSYILALYEDQEKTVWIGHNNGFSTVNNGYDTVSWNCPFRKQDPKSVNFNFVSGFAELNGLLYISTYGGGLSQMNPDSTFNHFTEKEGLSNNVLHSIAADASGALWMTSNGGVSRFSPADSTFINFTEANGLLSHNFSIGSVDRSIPGHLLFGTVDGLLTFNPDLIQTMYKSPELKIEQVDVNYQPIDHRDSYLDKPIVMDYDDKVLAVTFAALEYNQPEDVLYRYRLNGFDDRWVTAMPAQRRLVYSSLPSGKYELEVSAFSGNNLFEPYTTSLDIVVLPALWERPIVFVPAILGLVLALSVFVYYLSRRKLKERVRELETREKIQAERERISRDLHDSVGTHFAQIISKLDYLYLGWNRTEIGDKQGYLGQVGEFARSGIRMLRETIWALDKSEVEVASLRSKINEYLKLCFDHHKTDYQFQFSSKIDRVHSTLALNCFRIIQESVSNSLRHAQPRHIHIRFKIDTEDQFELSIVDDGAGFDVPTGKTLNGHYGLENMESRAIELGARFDLDSSDKGTSIKVYK